MARVLRRAMTVAARGLAQLTFTATIIAVITVAGAASASHASPASRLGVTVDGSGLAGLAPGGIVPASYTITNPNPVPVTLIDLSPGHSVLSSFFVDVAHLRCDPAWFSFIPQGGESRTYGPHRSASYTGSVQMEDPDVNQDGCKGATVRISLFATVAHQP